MPQLLAFAIRSCEDRERTMTTMPDLRSPDTITLTWLLRLRWVAIIGQLTAVALAKIAFRADLPWWPLIIVLGLAAFFTSWMSDGAHPQREDLERHLAFVMVVDVLQLTAVLSLTGGAHNPFTSFYLLHIALAAMTVTERRLWLVMGACVAGYVFVSICYRPLIIDGDEMAVHCPGYQWHLHGMTVAFVLTAACITFFVARMHRSLRQREAELAEAERRAVRGDQFTALATLSAGVAHEMGSPLGTIAVTTREIEHALEKGTGDASALEDVRLIRREVERCSSILQRLNKDSTQGIGDVPEEISIAALVEELKKSVGGSCADRLRTEDLNAEQILFLPRNAVVQALSVLVQNACQSDHSGKLVMLRIECDAETCTFRVRDFGPGFDGQAMRHAGKPFFTTKPVGQGMGLGLSISYGIVQEHGGTIHAEPAPDRGTRFVVRLPGAPGTLGGPR